MQRSNKVRDAEILETDPEMPPITKCECGGTPVEFRFGIFFAVACGECERMMTTCSTRIGAIGKWNRSIKLLPLRY